MVWRCQELSYGNTADDANALFHVISQRCLKGSIILTADQGVGSWELRRRPSPTRCWRPSASGHTEGPPREHWSVGPLGQMWPAAVWNRVMIRR